MALHNGRLSILLRSKREKLFFWGRAVVCLYVEKKLCSLFLVKRNTLDTLERKKNNFWTWSRWWMNGSKNKLSVDQEKYFFPFLFTKKILFERKNCVLRKISIKTWRYTKKTAVDGEFHFLASKHWDKNFNPRIILQF